MTFPVKEWKDFPDQSTPINAASLKDMEQRIADHFESGRLYLAAPSGSAATDTAEIDEALAEAVAAGGGHIIGKPGFFHKLTEGHTLAPPSNVKLDVGLDVSAWTLAGTVLVPTGALGGGIPLTANAVEGDLTLTAASWAGIAVDDWIKITSQATACRDLMLYPYALLYPAPNIFPAMSPFPPVHDVSQTRANRPRYYPRSRKRVIR